MPPRTPAPLLLRHCSMDADSDEEKERMALDEDDAAIDVEADEEHDAETMHETTPMRSSTPLTLPLSLSLAMPLAEMCTKSGNCLERNESLATGSTQSMPMDATSTTTGSSAAASGDADKSINQKAY
ncbi:homeobox protein Hmx [Drosophila madeirensis]